MSQTDEFAVSSDYFLTLAKSEITHRPIGITQKMFTMHAMLCIVRTMLSQDADLSVCPSHAGIV